MGNTLLYMLPFEVESDNDYDTITDEEIIKSVWKQLKKLNTKEKVTNSLEMMNQAKYFLTEQGEV